MATQKKKDLPVEQEIDKLVLKQDFDKTKRYRRWCLTIWDLKKFPDKKTLQDFICLKKVRYAIFGLEHAPTTGNLHFQGYIHYENGCTFDAITKLFGNAHCEPTRGSENDNNVYISKEDTEPLIIGTPNVAKPVMDKGDIAQAIVQLMYDREGDVNVFDLIQVAPDYADYIVKNYRTLKEISFDMRACFCKQHKNIANQIGFVDILPPHDMPF